MPEKATVVEIEGRRLQLSNLEKVLYPATGFTKGQVIDYYARIAPVMLPHLKDHPLTLKRYPNGVDEEFFFEKNATKYRPEWVKTAPIWSDESKREIAAFVCDDVESLLHVVNMGTIPLHALMLRHAPATVWRPGSATTS